MVHGLGSRVEGLGFGVECSGFSVKCLVFRRQCSVFSVQCLGFRAECLAFRVQGLGSGVYRHRGVAGGRGQSRLARLLFSLIRRPNQIYYALTNFS